MINISPPTDDAGVVFAACATRTQSVPRRNTLLAQRPWVEARAALYLHHALQNSLHAFNPQQPVNIPAGELSGLYGRVLVKGGERATYLRLRGLARYGRCPFCAQRDVTTLDHYLSRDDYPELSVYLTNLVPSCSVCNHKKSTFRATNSQTRLFHPYFDDWSCHRLIKASIEFVGGVVVSYEVRDPAGVDQNEIRRARHHFDRLNLKALYGDNAAVELVERRQYFHEVFAADGAGGLRD